jgi:hypothetical protein
MGTTARWEQIIIVPDKYWETSFDNVKWIYKESECQKKS